MDFDKGDSVVHAMDSEELGPGHRINDLGKSVLHEISKGEGATDSIGTLVHDVAFGGGNSGAVVSPAPELGTSAYQSPKAIDEGTKVS
jgi:hypothetical protein